jgi:hypothetical protein
MPENEVISIAIAANTAKKRFFAIFSAILS